LVSTVAYAYYTFANSLQLLPVSFFGASIAKASLPAMANQVAAGERAQFAKTFMASFREILFLVLPLAVFLAVARIPVTRIAFGAARFAWGSTIQTGYVVSAFSLGISAQALIYLLARAFYALHEVRIPVRASITGIFLAMGLGGIFILVGHLPIWSLALAYSLAAIVQLGILLFSLQRRVREVQLKEVGGAVFKIGLAAGLAGGVIYFLLKVLDRVIFDTRYVSTLILFVALLLIVGVAVYWLAAWALRIEEVAVFVRLGKRLGWRGWRSKGQLQQNEVVGREGETF
jgi:putative peptidoglycan lipid II flippase